MGILYDFIQRSERIVLKGPIVVQSSLGQIITETTHENVPGRHIASIGHTGLREH